MYHYAYHGAIELPGRVCVIAVGYRPRPGNETGLYPFTEIEPHLPAVTISKIAQCKCTSHNPPVSSLAPWYA